MSRTASIYTNENNNMQHKTLIAFSLIFFALSAVFLFWQNERELDPDQGKNWWILSFALPQDPSSLSFMVENHSDQTAFRYEIIVNKEIRLQDTFSVNRGETLTVTPPLSAKTGERTSITVSSDKDKDRKEIYRQ